MSERPILFSDAMVRAILENRKTETRRVVKGEVRTDRYPYGRAGDLLYVRESWAAAKCLDDKSPRRIGDMAEDAGFRPGAPIWYRSDNMYNMWTDLENARKRWGGKGRGRPSIHMPKWASRIWLRVAEVRIERLQGITPTAILAEGVEPTGSTRGDQERWAALWDGINAGRGYAWASNPWVWVVRFEVASTTGRPL